MTMRRQYPERPWLVVGTVPDPDFPLTVARCRMSGNTLDLDGKAVPVNRGTPALLASAALVLDCLERAGGSDGFRGAPLLAVLAGDTGGGSGSRVVYAALIEALPELRPAGVTFHYLLPDVEMHGRILIALEALAERPLLVADAGYMYAAKMSGYAVEYDLFTPDIGELAFLADPDAPHPFYTRNFLLEDESRAEALIAAAYAHGNAARNMLVKGKTDRYVRRGEILATVDGPDVPMLEPVGGTGDTLTGLATALLAAGREMEEACVTAMRANRQMGALTRPTPASGVGELIMALPEALRQVEGGSRSGRG